ncbi:MAG TPA: hypothetical protein VKU94_07180 [Geobacterales bacterium]|nr:hypothetical protein [Geobacterales bacterium]
MSKVLFVAFKEAASRTKRLAKELNATVFSIKENFPYLFSMFFTLITVLRQRPKAIILQLTQGPPLLFLVLLKKFLKFNLILDMHTGFAVYIGIKGRLLNKPFYKFIRSGDLIILHNRTILRFFDEEIKRKIIIIKDPLLEENVVPFDFPNSFIIFTTLTFQGDEPLELIEKLASYFKKEALFVFTSKKKVNLNGLVNVGYLSYNDYLRLLKRADIVLALTKREYTSLSLAFEAVSLKKALICSKTQTLQEVFYGKVILASKFSEFLDSIKALMSEEFRRRYEQELSQLYEILKNERDSSLFILKKILNSI